MFLQYGSYGKKSTTKQQAPKIIDRASTSFQPNDEFAFSDFFIRKHPKIIDANHLDQQKLELPFYKKQISGWIHNAQKDGTQQKKDKQKIFSLPNKKAFQIKFLQNKSKNVAGLQLILRKQSSHRFKDKRELIQQRKTRTNLSCTPRPSTRYCNGNNAVQQNYTSLMSQQKNEQRKSLQLSTNMAEVPNSNIQQKEDLNLANAYKIKSLVLGKNPKEEFYSKSKKFIKNLFEKRNSANKINTSRAQSQQPSNISSGIFAQTSRLSTQYRNSHTNNLRLPSTTKQNFRKSAKLNSIFQNLNEQFRSQQLGLEPWSKNNDIQLFTDNIHELEVNFKEEKNNSDAENVYLNTANGQKSVRNSFRKIYSHKQEAKLKGTIFSQK